MKELVLNTSLVLKNIFKNFQPCFQVLVQQWLRNFSMESGKAFAEDGEANKQFTKLRF